MTVTVTNNNTMASTPEVTVLNGQETEPKAEEKVETETNTEEQPEQTEETIFDVIGYVGSSPSANADDSLEQNAEEEEKFDTLNPQNIPRSTINMDEEIATVLNQREISLAEEDKQRYNLLKFQSFKEKTEERPRRPSFMRAKEENKKSVLSSSLPSGFIVPRVETTSRRTRRRVRTVSKIPFRGEEDKPDKREEMMKKKGKTQDEKPNSKLASSTSSVDKKFRRFRRKDEEEQKYSKRDEALEKSLKIREEKLKADKEEREKQERIRKLVLRDNPDIKDDTKLRSKISEIRKRRTKFGTYEISKKISRKVPKPDRSLEVKKRKDEEVKEDISSESVNEVESQADFQKELIDEVKEEVVNPGILGIMVQYYSLLVFYLFYFKKTITIVFYVDFTRILIVTFLALVIYKYVYPYFYNNSDSQID